MTMGFETVIDRFKQPAYTGENRCIPCTLVNLVLAAITAIALVAVLGFRNVDLPIALLIGLAAFTGAALVIYLRGYLVPGTPWVTRTYFPDRLLRVFDKHPVPTGAGEFDTEGFLKTVDAVEECKNEDDICLTPGFRAAWHQRIAALHDEDTTRDDLAGILGVEPSDLEFEEHGEAFVARVDGRRVGQWESRAAFLADVAAANELSARYAAWGTVNIQRQSEVLNGLRLFLEECPSCGGRVELAGDVVRSCCRSIDVVAVTCQACDARLFEAEQPA